MARVYTGGMQSLRYEISALHCREAAAAPTTPPCRRARFLAEADDWQRRADQARLDEAAAARAAGITWAPSQPADPEA